MQDQKPLSETLNELARRYPAEMVHDQLRDIPRIVFSVGIALRAVADRAPNDVAICDLGGGVGLFSLACAASGMKRTVLVDDFSDPVNQQRGDSILAQHHELGIEIHSRNVVERGMEGIAGGLDVVTTFDSMEHWHHSPKKLFHEVVEKLNPGGAFVLGVPNSVNIRKRISIPLGVGKWSPMDDWYEAETFRGHVREPDVPDLRYIARDMGLVNVRVYGRNWLGYYSGNPAVRFVTKIADYPLRLRPSLCSDIYVVGNKA